MGFFTSIKGITTPNPQDIRYGNQEYNANILNATNKYGDFSKQEAIAQLTGTGLENNPEFVDAFVNYKSVIGKPVEKTDRNRKSQENPFGKYTEPQGRMSPEGKAAVERMNQVMLKNGFTPDQINLANEISFGVGKTGGNVFTQLGRIGQAITNNPVFPAALAAFGIPAALGSAGAAGAAGAGAAGAGAGSAGTGLGALATSALGATGAGAGTGIGASALGALGGLSGAGAAGFGTAGTAGLGASALGALGGLTGTAGGGGIGASALGALGAAGAAPTVLGSETLGALAGSLGLGNTVEAAPNVLGSLGLSGGGSTALGSGVLSNLLGGGGQAGGSSGLFGTGLSLQDLLVGGGTAAGAYYASDAAKKASEQQAQAAQQGIDIVRGAADRGINTLQTSSDKAATFQQPFYSAGQNALTRLQKILGLGGQAPDFTEITNNPAYQFRLQQGNNAVQNSAANAGNLFSGQTGKALTNYSQGLASTEYQNIINNLSNEVGRGQNAGNQLSNIFQNTGVNQSNVGIQTGGAIADLLRTKGDAVASGTVGRTNAITGGVENLTNYLTRPVQYA